MEINAIRLLVIADDPLARAGLAALLTDQPDFTVVGRVSSETDLLTELDIYQPEVILCDLGWSPPEVLEQLIDLRNINLPTVFLLPSIAFVGEAWAFGAQGLLLRDVEVNQLTAALIAGAQGLVTIDPGLVEPLLPGSPVDTPPLAEDLTPRELEVLQHLAEGLPNKSIARNLNISENTVKFHVNAIMSKLGAQSRTEAVVRATQLGLILL